MGIEASNGGWTIWQFMWFTGIYMDILTLNISQRTKWPCSIAMLNQSCWIILGDDSPSQSVSTWGLGMVFIINGFLIWCSQHSKSLRNHAFRVVNKKSMDHWSLNDGMFVHRFSRIPMVHTSTSSYASIPHGKEALRSGGGREFPNLSSGMHQGLVSTGTVRK